MSKNISDNSGTPVLPRPRDIYGRAAETLRASERWHTQTIIGGGDAPPDKRGDCVRACITSILGVPITAMENVHGENWWDRLQAEVGRFGYALAILDVRMDPPRFYWLASLPSLVLGPEPDGAVALHCVIARGYELVHDPGMVRQYTAGEWAQAWNANSVVEGWALVPLDPIDLTVLAQASASDGEATANTTAKPSPKETL